MYACRVARRRGPRGAPGTKVLRGGGGSKWGVSRLVLPGVPLLRPRAPLAPLHAGAIGRNPSRQWPHAEITSASPSSCLFYALLVPYTSTVIFFVAAQILFLEHGTVEVLTCAYWIFWLADSRILKFQKLIFAIVLSSRWGKNTPHHWIPHCLGKPYLYIFH